MLGPAKKTFSKNSPSVVRNESQKQGRGVQSAIQFADNRPESIIQRKLKEILANSTSAKQMKVLQNMTKNHSKELSKKTINTINPFVQKNINTDITPVQRVAVSNAAMWSLFNKKNGDEWFFWGKGGYHVGAIRPSNGDGEVTDFHVKKEFKGARTNRIDWEANDNTYNEIEPPTKLQYDNETVIDSMRTLGEETKSLLIRNKK